MSDVSKSLTTTHDNPPATNPWMKVPLDLIEHQHVERTSTQGGGGAVDLFGIFAWNDKKPSRVHKTFSRNCCNLVMPKKPAQFLLVDSRMVEASAGIVPRYRVNKLICSSLGHDNFCKEPWVILSQVMLDSFDKSTEKFQWTYVTEVIPNSKRGQPPGLRIRPCTELYYDMFAVHQVPIRRSKRVVCNRLRHRL